MSEIEDIQSTPVTQEEVIPQSAPAQTPVATQGSADVSFNLNSVEEAKSNFDDPLEPKTYNFIIRSIEYKVPEEKDGKVPSPYAAIHLETKAGKHEERLYMSEAAAPSSLSRFKHFVRAALNYDAQLEDQVIDFNTANKILTGKKVKIRLSGEESMGKNGVFMRVSFGWPPFAESMEVGAEQSKLKAVKIKRLPAGAATAPATPSTGVPGGSEVLDDLPF